MIKVRQATERDLEEIKELCHKYNKRLPSEYGMGLVCVNEENKIIGFANIAPKVFIDPLVIDEDKKPIEKVKIIDAMGNFIDGYCAGNGIGVVYYTATGEDFTNFLDKRFGSELFTEESTYRIKR